MCMPVVDKNYQMVAWCPRAIQNVESRSFSMYDGLPEKMHYVLNTQNYKGSLKDAYEQKSMDKGRTEDRLLLRARKPYFKKVDRSLSLNFNGRVKKASKKNIQIVIISL